MPATPDRANFIQQEVRVERAGPDAAVVAAYGDRARKTEQSIVTAFDSVLDVNAIANQRLTLLKPHRARYVAECTGEQTGLTLDYSQSSPTMRVVEPLSETDKPGIVLSISIDTGAEKTNLGLWG